MTYFKVSLCVIVKEIYKRVVTIQRHWRGFAERKRLRRLNQTLASFQLKYRARREMNERRAQRRLAEQELKFQLVLAHRRRQRQRKCELAELIQILPADQIALFEERQRDYAATIIQSCFRGYRQRRAFMATRQNAIEKRAAITIQTTVRLTTTSLIIDN